MSPDASSNGFPDPPFPPTEILTPVLVYMMPSTAQRYQDEIRREGSFLIPVGEWKNDPDEDGNEGETIPIFGVGMSQEAVAHAMMSTTRDDD